MSATTTSLHDALAGVDYRLPRGGAQTGAVMRVLSHGGGKTNVLGAENVMRAATECGVSAVVVLSHRQGGVSHQCDGHIKGDDGKGDDREVAGLLGRDHRLCATRYGNVMASSGSVIPLFLRQLIEGVPLRSPTEHDPVSYVA